MNVKCAYEICVLVHKLNEKGWKLSYFLFFKVLGVGLVASTDDDDVELVKQDADVSQVGTHTKVHRV